MSSMKFSLRFQKKVSISAKFDLSIWICCVLWVTCTQWSAAQATLTETGVETTLTIEQAVENALAQNPSILAVMENAAFAEGEVESARERPNPSFSAGYETAGSRFRDWVVGWEQELETAGKRKYRTLVGEEHVERAHYELENAKRLLTQEVRLAYLEVARVQSLQRICQDFADFLEEFLQFNELLTQEGEIPPINVQLVGLESDGIANEQLRYQMRLKLSKTRLAQLMGMPLGFSFVVDSNSFKIPPDLPSPQELLTYSLEHRPDLKIMESDLTAAEHQLSLEAARSKPNAVIGLDLHGKKEDFGTSEQGSFTAIGFHFTIPIPIFDRNHGGINRATATRSSLRAQVAYARYSVETEVLAEVGNYSLAAQVFELNSERIVRARETAGALGQGYVLGATAVTDVLSIERAVFELKKEFALVEFERNSAWVKLQASIGENSIEDLVNVNGQVTQ